MVMVVLSSGNRMKSNLSRNFFFPSLATQKLYVCFQDGRCLPDSPLFLLFVEELGDLLDAVVRVCVR